MIVKLITPFTFIIIIGAAAIAIAFANLKFIVDYCQCNHAKCHRPNYDHSDGVICAETLTDLMIKQFSILATNITTFSSHPLLA